MSTRTPLDSLSQAGKLEAWVWAAVVVGEFSVLRAFIFQLSPTLGDGLLC